LQFGGAITDRTLIRLASEAMANAKERNDQILRRK